MVVLMGIVDEDIARVREASDLVQLVSQHVGLKRVGRSWVGLCPFHQENTPSFSVNGEKGLYYCYGCGAGGDAITFVREIEHTDFAGAVEHLAHRAGITLRYTDAQQSDSRKARSRLVELVARAVDFYHQRLLTGADAGPARAYLRARGFDGDLVRAYRLGWAPDAWDELSRHLHVDDRLLTDSGLGFVNRAGRQQDFFRARVLFPIADAQGDPVGFGGRKLPGADGPKYRNTADTLLYHKSKVLYGLDRAKAEIVNHDRVVVCEGYTDVIGFASAGVPTAVATCGTSLTEDHVRVLRRFTRRIVLAFDPDSAGRAAAERVYGWERAHDLEVSVVALPPGEDPADVARRDPAALVAAVDSAQRFLGFRVDRALEAGEMATPEGRARAAAAALEVIAEHPDELVRDQYLMLVADRCRLDEALLRSRLDRRRAQPGAGGGPLTRRSSALTEGRAAPPSVAGDRARPGGAGERFRPTPETEALRLLVQRPDETLQRFPDVLFADPANLEVVRALRSTSGDARAAAAQLDERATAMLARVAVDETEADPDDVLARLADRAASRVLADLEREARTSGDPLAFAPVIKWLKLRLEEVRDERNVGGEPLEQLVAWLSEHAAEGA